ncbi:Adenylate cyclase, partial [uncultured Microcoleus sp.]
EKLAQDVTEPSFVDTAGGANLRSSGRDWMAVVSQR